MRLYSVSEEVKSGNYGNGKFKLIRQIRLWKKTVKLFTLTCYSFATKIIIDISPALAFSLTSKESDLEYTDKLFPACLMSLLWQCHDVPRSQQWEWVGLYHNRWWTKLFSPNIKKCILGRLPLTAAQSWMWTPGAAQWLPTRDELNCRKHVSLCYTVVWLHVTIKDSSVHLEFKLWLSTKTHKTCPILKEMFERNQTTMIKRAMSTKCLFHNPSLMLWKHVRTDYECRYSENKALIRLGLSELLRHQINTVGWKTKASN